MRRILYMIIFILVPLITLAQATKRCGTYEYWELLKLKYPTLAGKEEKINNDAKEWIARRDLQRSSASVITIPVVIHVLYHLPAENISDAQIQSQIDVLNEDFAKLNSDIILVPSVWGALAGGVQVNFCLATLTPEGHETSGIERIYSVRESWDISSLDSIKHSIQGGLDIWNRDAYLNIWVANISGGLLGITQLPGGPPDTDGMCVLYSAFGRVGNVSAPYDKGKTATHEAGHWLGLYHVWGDDGGDCTGTDQIDDTPNQADATFGHPTFPLLDSCSPNSPGVMFMNYMDYTDDASMHLFTNDQATHMTAILNTVRSSIQNLSMCAISSSKEFIHVFNPGPGSLIAIRVSFDSPTSLQINMFDLLGRSVFVKKEEPAMEALFNMSMEDISNGIYILELRSPDVSVSQKISVQH